MDFEKQILEKLSKLPEAKQHEVINFIELISAENSDVQLPNENRDWSKFSLLSALRGTEDEPNLYSNKDIKIKYE